MTVNGDAMSGVPEEYVSGRLSTRVMSVTGLRFEMVSKPAYGRFGWNNSVSGEFIYSPRTYSMDTTNHGRLATNLASEMVPGCEDTCTGCPAETASTQQKGWVTDRPCVAVSAPVDRDMFHFRAVNQYGVSNWAKVTINFERADKSDGFLNILMLIGWTMMAATVCGMLRVVALQAILNPDHQYAVCGRVCGGFCAPVEESTISGLSASDVKHDMYDDEDETVNPLTDGAEEGDEKDVE